MSVTVVAVPVKDLDAAKQRLVPLLGPEERQQLARAMLTDVLRALAAARVDEVWVVTRDPGAEALARAHGAAVLGESANRGHTSAAATAQAAARARGVRALATIPGDVPCVTPGEVDRLLAAVAGAGPKAAFAASRSGLGTNGAALAPPDALPLRFGEPSFADHLAAARARGIEPTVLELPGLALDIDGPDDVAALLREGVATDAGRLVAGWDVGRRLGDRTVNPATSQAGSP